MSNRRSPSALRAVARDTLNRKRFDTSGPPPRPGSSSRSQPPASSSSNSARTTCSAWPSSSRPTPTCRSAPSTPPSLRSRSAPARPPCSASTGATSASCGRTQRDLAQRSRHRQWIIGSSHDTLQACSKVNHCQCPLIRAGRALRPAAVAGWKRQPANESATSSPAPLPEQRAHPAHASPSQPPIIANTPKRPGALR